MKIFLSYASEQRSVAEQIKLALTPQHQVFFDRDSIAAGSDFHARIRREVEASDRFVFLISPQSITAGKYTLTELKFAREKWPDPEEGVLPVMVEKTDYGAIPPYLTSISVLEPEGNVAAEVAAFIDRWFPPDTPPSQVRVSGKALLSLLLPIVGTLGLGEGPGAFFAEYLNVQNALVMVFLAAVALVLGISAWVDINRGRAKGKPLAVVAVALAALEFLGLGMALLVALA